MLSEQDFINLLKTAKEKTKRKTSDVDSFTSPLSKEFNSAAAESKSIGKSTVKSVEINKSAPLAPVSRSMSGIVVSSQTRQPTQAASNDQLWVDKYKPTQMEHMIGSNEIVSKLT